MTENKASNKQIGGSHYKSFEIQPAEFITKNKLGFLEGCIVKRICRYSVPGGKGLQDLQKIKHEIDLLIEYNPQAEKSDEPQTDIFENMDYSTLKKEWTV